MLLNCSCKSFLIVQLNCWRNGKNFNNQPELKISSIVYLCISMLIYHDLHCLSPSPSLQKNKKSLWSSASSPFHHPLPQLIPPQQLSLNTDLLGSSPSTRTSSAAVPANHKNPRSRTSLQKFRPLHVWLPAQAFSCTVPSSSSKTIKWSSLLN